jgi:hypothetical protein
MIATRVEGCCIKINGVSEKFEGANQTHGGDLDGYLTDCRPRDKDEDSNNYGEPKLLGNDECTAGIGEVSRVTWVLEIRGDGKDPNES